MTSAWRQFSGTWWSVLAKNMIDHDSISRLFTSEYVLMYWQMMINCWVNAPGNSFYLHNDQLKVSFKSKIDTANAKQAVQIYRSLAKKISLIIFQSRWLYLSRCKLHANYTSGRETICMGYHAETWRMRTLQMSVFICNLHFRQAILSQVKKKKSLLFISCIDTAFACVTNKLSLAFPISKFELGPFGPIICIIIFTLI